MISTSSASSERLVLALTQVFGATAAIRAHGDQPTLDAAREANAVVRDAVDRVGGRVIKSLGGGLLLAFPVDRAREAVSALQAARAHANLVWRAFDSGCEMHVTATVGTVLVGDLGLVPDQTRDVWGLAVHELFKEKASGFVLLPDLKALLEAQ